VADRQIRDIFLQRLHQDQRHRLINRLIAYLLFLLGFYILLLFVMMFLDFPLLLFHFVLFTAISLLPLFLILEPERERTVTVLRRIDKHSQIESFLSTRSTEHRSFLEPRVRNLLLRPEAVLRLHLTKGNRFLAIGILCLFLLFQLASLINFQRPSFDARSVKNLKTQAEISGRREPEDAGLRRSTPGGEVPEAGDPAEASAESSAERRERSGETRAMDRDLAPAEGDQEFSGAETAFPPTEGQAEESFPWVPLPIPEGGIGQALKGALEQSPDPATRQGKLPAGSGEAGEALMDSPLREYSASALRELIQTEGGTRLTAETAPGATKESSLIQALFGDFPSIAVGEAGFDPAIERISRRYLETLNERY
jgi:hypothetical protein